MVFANLLLVSGSLLFCMFVLPPPGTSEIFERRRWVFWVYCCSTEHRAVVRTVCEIQPLAKFRFFRWYTVLYTLSPRIILVENGYI